MKIKAYAALYREQNFFGIWFILALLSFLTTLGLPYQGEEAVYTITTMEMAFNQEWLVPTQYGDNYARPPLLNWLMLPFAMVLGWDQVLVASRLLTILITLSTCLLLIWFTQKLFKNRSLAIFSALIYLSGDVLFRRGWLAYADPLFSLCVFGAIAFAWMAVQEKRVGYLLLALLGLIASFLTKAVTGYVFYAVALLVLFWKMENRRFLLTPSSIILHLLAFLFPLVWNIFLSQGAHGHSMLNDILVKLQLIHIPHYITKVMLYPLDTLARWLPVSGILGYYWIKNVLGKNQDTHFVLWGVQNPKITIALWISVLNFIPYWVVPVTHARYTMPLYPFIALVFAYLFWEMGKDKVTVVMSWLIAGILMRYLAGFLVFPYYEEHYRGNYQKVAKDILSITQERPLYVLDVTATGLSVVAHLDALRQPKIVTTPRGDWQQGYLLMNNPQFPNTVVSKIYPLGSHSLYLLCRGSGC